MLFSGSSPAAMTMRRQNPYRTLNAVSVRRGTMSGSTLNASIVTIAGNSGYTAYSLDSGGGWVPQAVVGTANAYVRGIDATDVAHSAVAAAGADPSGTLWIQPLTGWQSRAPTSRPDIYNAIACQGVVDQCFAVGAQDTFTQFGMVSPFTATNLTGPNISGVEWFDVDSVVAPGNIVHTLRVGHLNGAYSRHQQFNAVLNTSSCPAGTTFDWRTAAYDRSGNGVALVAGTAGKVGVSTGFDVCPVVAPNTLPDDTDIFDSVHLVGTNKWILAGRNGRAWIATRGTSNSLTFTELLVPVESDIVGVAASDVDPRMIWVVTRDGEMAVSTVGGL
jgi:hypothetical protein